MTRGVTFAAGAAAGLALASGVALLAASPARPAVGYGDHGRLRAALGAYRLRTAEELGAVGDGRTDDTARLQAGLDRPGTVVLLAPGKTYRLGRSLMLRSGGGIVGHGAVPGRLLMPAASFDCDAAAGCRAYMADPRAVGLAFIGPPTGAGALHDIVLDRFAIAGEGAAQQGRTLMAISCRNVRNLSITRLDISAMPNAIGIRCSGLTGRSLIADNRIHGFRDNSPGPLPHLMAGIAIDADGADFSHGLRIERNRIADIRYGPAFAARYAQQSSGIVTITGGTGIVARGNSIDRVGQGFDWHASDGIIADNVVTNADLFCVKLIHGASRNLVTRNRLEGCGIGGVSIGGGDNIAAVSGNRIAGNIISGIDRDGRHAASASTAAFWLAGSSTRFHATGNRIEGNRVDPGRAKWIAFDGDPGNRGNLLLGTKISRPPARGVTNGSRGLAVR